MKSVRSKIVIGFSIILLVLIVMSSFNLYNVYKVNSTVENMLQEYLQIMHVSDDLARITIEKHDTVRSFVLLGSDVYKDQYEQLLVDAHLLEEEILTLNDNTLTRELIKKSTLWNDRVQNEVINVYDREKAHDVQIKFEQNIEPLTNEIIAGYRNFSGAGQTKIIEIRNEMSQHGEATVFYNLVVIIIGIILSLIIGLTTAHKIVAPIKAVVNSVEQIAKGDLTGNTIKVKTKDEIGRLTNSINEMALNLRNLIAKTTNMSANVLEASKQLSHSSKENTVSTNQIIDTILEVLKASEVTVSSTQESAQAIDEMTLGIKRIADSSCVVLESSLAATEEAVNGNESLQKVIEQMQTISEAVKDATRIIGKLVERSNEIGSILAVITDISDQTNLLALNAAIEAARAGTNGNGFAVVAGEVRKLAEQSRKSAEKVTSVIHKIQSETDVAVATMDNGTKEVQVGLLVVEETKSAFESIKKSIENVSHQIQGVSATAEEMKASSEEVGSSVEKMSDVSIETSARIQLVAAGSTQQLSSMQEIENSAIKLNHLSEDLLLEISKFKV